MSGCIELKFEARLLPPQPEMALFTQVRCDTCYHYSHPPSLSLPRANVEKRCTLSECVEELINTILDHHSLFHSDFHNSKFKSVDKFDNEPDHVTNTPRPAYLS